MPHELEIGELLDQRFRVECLLNEGGMAAIYRAHDTATGETVALKIPLMKYESHPVFFRQFHRERDILAKLHHPAILRLIPVDPDLQSRPYLVTEFLDGQLLHDVLAQKGSFDVPRAIALLIRLCQAMAYVHDQGVIHRDLKPGNIMLCHDGSIRIFDFGLAITPSQKRAAPAGFDGSLGTALYMAPEQIRGRRGDARVDIYALGSILYELTTGARPYPMEDTEQSAYARLTGDPVAPRQLNPAISPELEEIILHALARDLDQRYESCRAMFADLENPQTVIMRNLSCHLQTPRPYRPLSRLILKWAALTAIPLLIFALLYVLGHTH